VSALRAALAYFSIVPVGWSEAPRADALAWLPFVGVLLGALAGGFGALVGLAAPHPLAAAAAFGATLVLTGAIHLDGFLDSCDGLFASVPVARRLEILEDPRHGTFALAGFGVLAAVWLAALVAIPTQNYPALLAFAGGSARFAAVLNAFVFPYGRAGGSAQAFERRPNLAILTAGLLAALACAWGRPVLLVLAVAAAALALGLGRLAAARLGGALVGDVYGAIVTVLEVGLLAAASVLP
jgi:adenosylcobinamide-GDP ribazoletransferase